MAQLVDLSKSKGFLQRFAAAIRNQKQANITSYRPWPLNGYFWPGSAQIWLEEAPARSEKEDEYPKEELYLDEIEARMHRYDSKFRMTDEMKKLYNEFGWEDQDDRAFYHYGGGISGEAQEMQYGRGKKLDPSMYINPEFQNVNRLPVPPVQLMTPEQVRRSRGSLAGFREVPPEPQSVLKFWNGYSTLGIFTTLLLSKEWLILGGHDIYETAMLWGFWGVTFSILTDWWAWFHAIHVQESYDRRYFMHKAKADAVGERIDVLVNKPDMVEILEKLKAYRVTLSERVLSKTVSNRVTGLLDATLAKLQDKLSEEQAIKKEAEKQWAKNALEATLAYVESEQVKDHFTAEALRQFTSGNTAQLGTTAAVTYADSSVFADRYQQAFGEARDGYLREQREAGRLSWVFKTEQERQQERLSSDEKAAAYNKEVREWEQLRNAVNAPQPAF